LNKKYKFIVIKVEFLSFIINYNGVYINLYKVDTIIK